MPELKNDISAWRRIALDHRASQLEKIPSEWRLDPSLVPPPTANQNVIPFVESHLSPEELEITSLSQSVPSIHGLISSRKFTIRQIVSAYSHRAVLLHQTTKCLTEPLFTSALSTALRLGEHSSVTDSENDSGLGSLRGIPISLKDNQDIAGVDSTLGWVGLINSPAKRSNPLVETLQSLGAVLYCKTNLPQSMMMSDSYNHIYGQSVTPLNTSLISGGSSGGEGALIAGGGSVLGIGTDIGGSVRIPAAINGLYGLCPSIGRVSNRESTRRDKYICPPVAGPMARDIDSINTFMEVYHSVQPWKSDPGVLPIPWDQSKVEKWSQMKPVGTAEKKLRIAYFEDDGRVRCQPPCSRAVRHTIDIFRRAGHEIIDWSPHATRLHGLAYDLWLKAVLGDGGSKFSTLCNLTDPPQELIKGMLVGTPETRLDTDQRMELYDQIWEYQREYMRLWEEAAIDVLVCPVQTYVGLKPKQWVVGDIYVGYTSHWNMIGWTSLVVPSIKVQKELDDKGHEWQEWTPRNKSEEFAKREYDVELFEGMPVGVQLVTGRLEEEKAVGIAMMLKHLERDE